MDTSRYNSQCINNLGFSSLAGRVFVTSPGEAYRNPVSYSHYNQPLETGGIRGESRIWGDASIETQSASINEILRVGSSMQFNDLELAFALSVARTESGFNPDAAAGTTSASGIGQLIDQTAKNVGVSQNKRFDLKENVKGYLKLLGGLIQTAKKQLPEDNQARIFERAYGLYHDGPSLAYGGQKLARLRVLPQIPIMLDWIRCNSLKTLPSQKN